ncbi:hypothetical protein Peur_047634 [Populus x canadensis]
MNLVVGSFAEDRIVSFLLISCGQQVIATQKFRKLALLAYGVNSGASLRNVLSLLAAFTGRRTPRTCVQRVPMLPSRQ